MIRLVAGMFCDGEGCGNVVPVHVEPRVVTHDGTPDMILRVPSPPDGWTHVRGRQLCPRCTIAEPAEAAPRS